jgi:alpha-galactosidase
MNRRHFIQTSGLSLAAILISDSFFGSPGKLLINFPDEVSAVVNDQLVKLKSKDAQVWAYRQLTVSIKNIHESIVATVHAPGIKLSSVILTWKTPLRNSASILNDQWERTYGDASWHKPAPAEILPWYFMEHDGQNTIGFAVKTGAKAFCSWQLSRDQLNLRIDTHSGGNGVELGSRNLQAAEIVTI